MSTQSLYLQAQKYTVRVTEGWKKVEQKNIIYSGQFGNKS